MRLNNRNYESLYKRLWQEVLAAEGRLEDGAEAFLKRFMEQLRASGMEITPGVEEALTRWFTAVDGEMHRSVAEAIKPVAAVYGMPTAMASGFVAEMAKQAFEEEWPDGLSLSKRLWRWTDETRRGVSKVLKHSVRAGQSVNSVIYAMQREIEKNGFDFHIVSNDSARWLERLAEAARAAIKTPSARSRWESELRKAWRTAERFAATGTRHAAMQAVNELQQAVNSGMDDLIDDAMRWYVYDRQLYNLKRIARTEMATACHRGIIKASEWDDDVIGYHWRLSASHKIFDVCNYYATVEMGLGKGVWPKDRVPRYKAHPHCMCKIIPRVTPIKEQGSASFSDFAESMPAKELDNIMPKWAHDLKRSGVPMHMLVGREWFHKQADVKKAMGDDLFDAAKALGKTLGKREWGNGERHLERRRSQGLAITMRDLNRRFEAVLKQPATEIWINRTERGKVTKIYCIDRENREISIMNNSGRRLTWHVRQHGSGIKGFIMDETRRAGKRGSSFTMAGTVAGLRSEK